MANVSRVDDVSNVEVEDLLTIIHLRMTFLLVCKSDESCTKFLESSNEVLLGALAEPEEFAVLEGGESALVKLYVKRITTFHQMYILDSLKLLNGPIHVELLFFIVEDNEV